MKAILLIVVTILFVFMTKAFPLPEYEGALILPDDFEVKSLDKLAQEFGIVLTGNETLTGPSLDQSDTLIEDIGPRDIEHVNKLNKRDWSYTCMIRGGPRPLIYWLYAYIYVAARLKKIGHNCKVSPGQACVNCGCTGGAAIQLCRGGLSPPRFEVANAEISDRSFDVIRVLIKNYLGQARCGFTIPGCADQNNCKYEGIASNGGLSEGWYILLVEERNIGRCIPV